jgi:hypothetical protein
MNRRDDIAAGEVPAEGSRAAEPSDMRMQGPDGSVAGRSWGLDL